MPRNDPRYVVGARVQAKAHHITALSECHRRYGALAKTKLVNGTVVSVDTAPSSSNKRTVTLITADYELGGGTVKRFQLNSRGVKLAEATSLSETTTQPVTALVTGGVEPINEANAVAAPPAAGVSNEAMLEMLQSSDEEEDGVRETVQTPRTPVQTPVASPASGYDTTPEERRHVALVHSIRWRRTSITEPPLNGAVNPRLWSVRNVIGEVLIPGANSAAINGMSPIDFFLLMFPPKQLLHMVDLTNAELLKLDLQPTNTSEILKFFGVLILMTSFEFTSRASLWTSVAPSKYRPAPHFGRTGMSKHRFNDLFRSVKWSKQPAERPQNVSSEQHRWMLVDDFVDNFNDHRANFFSPSETICVDESMSRWYGQGGHWINHGLPQYVAIDRKPENGCEIQNAACGRSGVMLRLKLVKGVDLVGEDTPVRDDCNNDQSASLLHGTQVLKAVVSPWFGTNRIVCADSYFASVGAAKELYRNGLRFIGVVKTATKGFPKTYLTSVELHQRGDFLALLSEAVDPLSPAMSAFVWMDRERRYFIATAGSLAEGTPYTRCRWRQVSQDPNAPPERITMTIKQPQIAELYYSTCGAIDRHNRFRQDDLRMEKKIETKDWSVRVNLSIFAMIIVDSWLVYNAFKNAPLEEEDQRKCLQKEFYSMLAEELIDNNYDHRGQGTRRPRSSPNGTSYQEACIRTVESGCARAGVFTHLTPVKRLKNAKGEKTSFRYQGRCKECQNKTTWQCSDCNDNGKTVFLCSTKNGKRCFVDHIARNHAHLDDF